MRKRKEEFEEDVTEKQTEKHLKKLANDDEEDQQRRMDAKRTTEELATEDEEEPRGRRTDNIPSSSDYVPNLSSRGSKRDRDDAEEGETIMESSVGDATIRTAGVKAYAVVKDR